MVFNNSTIINKANTYLSPQSIEHKQIMTYADGDPWTCTKMWQG
jgi:hypothetical protein